MKNGDYVRHQIYGDGVVFLLRKSTALVDFDEHGLVNVALKTVEEVHPQ
ncbi:hypothetical protein [Paenibacillus typhae]|nr:hypothetical protein [Paenibacillus typhae]MBY0011480.1 hypothetical protein [Paenibacillus typhae]